MTVDECTDSEALQLSYTSLRTSIRVVAEGKECGRRRTEIDERALMVAVSVT